MEIFKEYMWAFVVGGLFCAVGQVLIDYTKRRLGFWWPL